MAEGRLPGEDKDSERERKYEREKKTKGKPGFQNPSPTSHTQNRQLLTRGVASIYTQETLGATQSFFNPQSAFTAAQSQRLHTPAT